MEISVVDMVYLISVNTNTSEQAALLDKYLPSVLTGNHDCCTLKVHVVTLLAGGHLQFLALCVCARACPII